MHVILADGIAMILWLQQFATPALTRAVSAFTDLGGVGYIVLLPLVVWCVDYRFGLRLLPVFAVSVWLNSWLKAWFAEPRPYLVDSQIVSAGEQGYGLPSGHAQFVVVFWGMLAAWARRAWLWYLALAIMFLIGLSRVYLGVHYPSDVVVGWAIGFATLWLWLRFGERLALWYASLGWPVQTAWLVLATAVLFVFNLVWFGDWVAAGAAGFLLGSGAGGLVGVRYLRFRGHGRWWRRLLRYLIGMAGIVALITALRRLGVPADGSGLAQVAVAIDMALLGVWMTLLAPALFCVLALGDGD